MKNMIDKTYNEKRFIFLKSSHSNLQALQKQFNLDPIIFQQSKSSVEVARFLPLTKTNLKDAHLLVSFDLKDSAAPIEQQLFPTIIIFNSNHLIICGTSIINQLPDLTPQSEIIDFIFKALLIQASHFEECMTKIKKEIDRLNEVARTTTSTKALRELCDLTHDIVYIKHTMSDQTETLTAFLDYCKDNNLSSSILLSQVHIEQRRLNKMINVYEDLLNSVSGLFSAMMDSHLNHLMKYLDTMALIISIPALIGSLWGMNVGGIPGKTSSWGFIGVLVICLISVIISGLYLRKKKYLTD